MRIPMLEQFEKELFVVNISKLSSRSVTNLKRKIIRLPTNNCNKLFYFLSYSSGSVYYYIRCDFKPLRETITRPILCSVVVDLTHNNNPERLSCLFQSNSNSLQNRHSELPMKWCSHVSYRATFCTTPVPTVHLLVKNWTKSKQVTVSVYH